MSAVPVMQVRRGRVALDSRLVLDGIDFALSSGEFLTLLGANGSGKTTLVRALLGLVPVEGEVRLFGDALASFRAWRRIGYVPQRLTAAAGGAASVMEVALSGRLARTRRFRRYGDADRSAALQALDTVGLRELSSRPVGRLSGGQHQRALIARALAGEPDVLVLDEPLSGVDAEHQAKIASALHEFHDRGGTVLLVAHGLGPIEDLVTREVVMDEGRVVYDGPHHPDHVHAEHVHHPQPPGMPSALDRAAGAE